MSRSSMSMSACLWAASIAILCTLPACSSSDDDDGGGGPTMTITSVVPNIGAVGDPVTITGTGFEANIADMEVEFFDGVSATITSASTTELEVTVPAGAVTGPITVTNLITSGSVTTTTDFTVTTTFGASVGTALHGIAIGPNGSVWTWGENAAGQLGDGTTTSTDTPAQVAGITTAVQVEAGQNFSIARLSDGTLRAWGANADGQLGNNSTTPSTTPVTVSTASGLTDCQMLDVSFALGVMALDADGEAFLWGDNTFGQLGNGTTTDTTIPTARPVADDALDFAIGEHTLVVKPDGTVGAWGRNNQGQLGDGTTTDSLLPVTVLVSLGPPPQGLSGVAKVAVGSGFSIAAMADGTVMAWGDNNLGALGNGLGPTDSLFPVVVTGLTNIVDVDACFDTAIALEADGTVWVWGGGLFGQLGNGTNTVAQTTAIQVPGLANIVDIDGGDAGFLVVESDGDRWAWGSNISGQLGNGTTTDSNVPVMVDDF